MRGHARPASIYRLQAARFAAREAAERARYLAEVRAEATIVLAERGYRLVSLDRWQLGHWHALFVPANGDSGEFEANEAGGNTLLAKLRLYPQRVPGGPFVNNVVITRAFMSTAIEGFQSLALFTRPQ